jgi:hypothetical protein
MSASDVSSIRMTAKTVDVEGEELKVIEIVV